MADQPAAVDGGVTLAERYEQLRRVVLDGHAEGWRHGLGVLASKGMAGWMAAWTSVPTAAAPTPAPANGVAITALGAGTAEIVRVMAAMALAHV